MFDCRSLFSLVGQLAQPDAFPGSAPFSVKKSDGGHFVVGRTHVHTINKVMNSFDTYMKL